MLVDEVVQLTVAGIVEGRLEIMAGSCPTMREVTAGRPLARSPNRVVLGFQPPLTIRDQSDRLLWSRIGWRPFGNACAQGQGVSEPAGVRKSPLESPLQNRPQTLGPLRRGAVPEIIRFR